MNRWIGLCDPLESRFDPGGLGIAHTNAPVAPLSALGLLSCRGTLMLEASFDQAGQDCMLMDVQRGDRFALRISLLRGRTMVFSLEVGGQEWTLRLPVAIEDSETILRISYAWDTVAKAGVVSVYQPRCGHLDQTLLPNPRPMRWSDLNSLFADNVCRHQAVELSFVALSREFEAAGPMPTLSGGTVIQTAQGPKAIRNVTTDDQIELDDGTYARPLKVVRRELPARGSLEPVRIYAPYFGLTRDMDVARGTRLRLSGSDVEYLLGTESVLVEASHLIDDRSVACSVATQVVPYYQLVMPEISILSGAVGMESLDLSRCQSSALSKSSTLLSDVPNPPHFAPSSLELHVARRYEVVTLNATRAA